MSEEKIILKAEDVRTYFPVKGALGQTVKEVKAVDGVSLALRQGETYGLVGESGCGKSTLGRTLIRLLEPTSGKITLFDQDITHLSKKEMLPFRRDVQIVFQDPYTSLNPRQRVGDMLMEVLAIHHIGDKNKRMARALDIMAQVGLRPEHFYRYPHEFSGGQRQRIGLARALILDPKIVVCDEPVSALDVSIQSQIINLLKELQRKRGLTYLFVAHDMSVIRYISDRVGVMYLGHLVEEGDTDEVFDHPQHPYTRTLMSAVPSIDPRDNRQRICWKAICPRRLTRRAGAYSTRVVRGRRKRAKRRAANCARCAKGTMRRVRGGSRNKRIPAELLLRLLCCLIFLVAGAKPLQQNSPFPLEKSKNRTTKITDQYTRFWSVILLFRRDDACTWGLFPPAGQADAPFRFRSADS